jgi:hypothetical protein
MLERLHEEGEFAQRVLVAWVTALLYKRDTIHHGM